MVCGVNTSPGGDLACSRIRPLPSIWDARCGASTVPQAPAVMAVVAAEEPGGVGWGRRVTAHWHLLYCSISGT